MNNRKPNVLQLIDSLAIGGAERMSVNLANGLAKEGVGSFLCATRKGGDLEAMIVPEVTYMVLGKRASVDLKALWRLAGFVRKNQIDIIHAHSSSFFTAVLVKLLTGVRVVWHDHNGNRIQANNTNKVIILGSVFFDAVISVNEKLAEWSRKHLLISEDRIVYLPNFAELTPTHTDSQLPGEPAKRIVCLANLREQKDHMTLLRAFNAFHVQHPQWHLLLVGEDSNDTYSASLKTYIAKEGLEDVVHILGSRSDSADILLASTIGVLSSVSEGLPVALLEYGLANLPVVCTDVGQCSEVLNHGSCGLLVPPGKPEELANALAALSSSCDQRATYASALYARVQRKYGQDAVVGELMKLYRSVWHG